MAAIWRMEKGDHEQFTEISKLLGVDQKRLANIALSLLKEHLQRNKKIVIDVSLADEPLEEIKIR